MLLNLWVQKWNLGLPSKAAFVIEPMGQISGLRGVKIQLSFYVAFEPKCDVSWLKVNMLKKENSRRVTLLQLKVQFSARRIKGFT
ncbi:hypothetical protein [Neobacillus sp. DY30]|uniref:hypothetical protein n=1 Tax=Neobacillus sp. DY30 TaxID=3047871 RepID=UPI0024BF1186|nr:hypothetical protein [Neobacillus sp. DY30]WHX98071.1 hypothetical protein QNH29_15475 [Neobacillus sp. DY30]